MRRLLAISCVGLLWAAAQAPVGAQPPEACSAGDLECWRAQHESSCALPVSTVESCISFIERLERIRRGARSTGVTLLLGDALLGLARQDSAPEAQQQYRERARAAYLEVARKEPLSAAGYLGLAAAADTDEERVDWLRGAVQAEFRPAHMELLADTLADMGGHEAELEAALTLENAFTLEATGAERWRYGASAWQQYMDVLDRYPLAASEISVQHVAIRIKDEIDYPLLQRIVLEPGAYLAYVADAFTKLCDKSIVSIVGADECLAGLELTVLTAEGSELFGIRRALADAVLAGMRALAAERVPKSAEQQRKFLDWIDRLLRTRLTPVDVVADLLEARADYSVDLLVRADALLSAAELSPNRADLRLKLGETFLALELWPEALEELAAAKDLLPPAEREHVDELIAGAQEAQQAQLSARAAVE